MQDAKLFAETLGSYVARHRRAAQLSQAEVAAKMKMSVWTIDGIERGEYDIDVGELIGLAEILDFDPGACMARWGRIARSFRRRGRVAA